MNSNCKQSVYKSNLKGLEIPAKFSNFCMVCTKPNSCSSYSYKLVHWTENNTPIGNQISISIKQKLLQKMNPVC